MTQHLPRTLVAQARAATTPASSLAASLMLPHMFPPRRYASQYQGAPTAVAAPFSVLQADWSIPDDDGAVPPGQYYFGVSRSPLTASFRYMPNPEHLQANYIAIFGDPDGDPPHSEIPFHNVTNTDPSTTAKLAFGWSLELDPLWWDDTDPELVTAYHPHGPTYYSVRTPDGKTAIYLDGTNTHPTSVTLYYSDSGLTPNHVVESGLGQPFVDFIAMRMAGNGWVQASHVATAANQSGVTSDKTPTITISSPGYYYFIVSTPPVPSRLDGETDIRNLQAIVSDYNCRVEFGISSAVIGFSPIAHLPDLDQEVMGCRVNAVSAMITPHPAMLYEGGQVAGVQLPTCCSWDQPLENDDPFSYITALQTSATMPLKKGLYAFHKPTGVDNFELQAPFITHRSVITGTNNPIVPYGGWVVFAATVPLTDAAYPSGACHLTITHAVEFQTTNTWFNVIPPTLTPRDYDAALEILRTTAQWHENPLHMRDILSTIATKGRALLRVAPSVAKIITALFPGTAVPRAIVDAAVAIGNTL